MKNQISFFEEGKGVLFTRNSGEKVAIAFIVVSNGNVLLKQNDYFPSLTIEELDSIVKQMKKIKKIIAN